MHKKEKWKIGLLSAVLPTVTTVLLAAVIGFVYKEVAVMGSNQIRQKAESYMGLSENAPKNATVFFGDSITELCPLEDIYADYTAQTGVPVCNRGISAECTASMLERAESTVIPLQPRNLVMLMGVNDLNQGVPQEEITENIRQIILKVKAQSPQTHIVLQAVYPTDPERESLYERFQLKGRENAVIRSLNQKLAVMAKEENVTFLDVTPLLADGNGNLRKDFTFDGLHPNSQGYLAVRQSILDCLH